MAYSKTRNTAQLSRNGNSTHECGDLRTLICRLKVTVHLDNTFMSTAVVNFNFAFDLVHDFFILRQEVSPILQRYCFRLSYNQFLLSHHFQHNNFTRCLMLCFPYVACKCVHCVQQILDVSLCGESLVTRATPHTEFSLAKLLPESKVIQLHRLHGKMLCLVANELAQLAKTTTVKLLPLAAEACDSEECPVADFDSVVVFLQQPVLFCTQQAAALSTNFSPLLTVSLQVTGGAQ